MRCALPKRYINFISLALVGTQLINAHFSAAVRGAVSAWRATLTFPTALQQLDDPVALGNLLLPDISRILQSRSQTCAAVKLYAWKAPFVYLPKVFDPLDLPDTPTGFLPVPDTEGTLLARASAIACNAVLGSSTVSYGSENNGALFVNLVVIPGESFQSEKSKGSMKGHTDGVWFPIRGEQHPWDNRVAPSPDFVCLSALRNPKQVPTTVMPLSDVLAKLTPETIGELGIPQFDIGPQGTFRDRLREIFGKDVIVEDCQLLFWVEGQPWIRYSHSSARTADDEPSIASLAMDQFKAACLECASSHPLEPGDIVLVNNRISLHGRAEVGEEHGGESRWLLRTYGLDTTELNKDQWHVNSKYMLYP